MPRISNRCVPSIRRPAASLFAIAAEVLARYDPHDAMFFNANTPEEYEKARQMLEKLEG
jgi:hypothetical protein